MNKKSNIIQQKVYDGDTTANISYVTVVPTMTSNSAPSPYVVASSSIYSASYPAWKAFDGINTSGSLDNGWLTVNGTTTGWLSFNFVTGKTIIAYQIYPYYTNPNIYAPKNWTFEGSNNNVDWTILDTRIGETGWISYVSRMYFFSNTTAYQYYRINITANNGHTYVAISELQMYDSTSIRSNIPTGYVNTYVTGNTLGITSPTTSYTYLLDNLYDQHLSGTSYIHNDGLKIYIGSDAITANANSGGGYYKVDYTAASANNINWDAFKIHPTNDTYGYVKIPYPDNVSWSGGTFNITIQYFMFYPVWTTANGEVRDGYCFSETVAPTFTFDLTGDTVQAVNHGFSDGDILNFWVTTWPGGIASYYLYGVKLFKNTMPTMTSNVLPAPYVASSSSQYSASYEAYRAFARSGVGTTWYTQQVAPQWLKFDYSTGRTIVAYGIETQWASSPKDWNFQGSNNNIDWDNLDTQTGITDWYDATQQHKRKQFFFSNSTAYRYYRLYVTAYNGTGLAIDELQMQDSSVNTANEFSLATNNVRYSFNDPKDGYLVNITSSGSGVVFTGAEIVFKIDAAVINEDTDLNTVQFDTVTAYTFSQLYSYDNKVSTNISLSNFDPTKKNTLYLRLGRDLTNDKNNMMKYAYVKSLILKNI